MRQVDRIRLAVKGHLAAAATLSTMLALVPAFAFAGGGSDALLFDANRVSQTGLKVPAPHSSAVPYSLFGSGRLIRGSLEPSYAGDAKGPITLNLVTVPVAQAAKAVLGDLMNATYVVDPRVNGTVSLQTTQGISKGAAFEIFQSALRVANATAILSDGIYRIVPTDQAATGSVGTGGRLPDNDLAGTTYRVMQLRFVAASEVARVLEPMVPHGAIVEADDARNIIAVRGSQAEMRNMIETIRLFDIDVMRGMSFAVVPVKSRQPDKMVEDLKGIFSPDKEGPMKGRVRFIADMRLGAVLVVTSQPSYLELAKDWIRRLDSQSEDSELQLHVYAVQNRPARDLADVLQTMFSSDAGTASSQNSVSPRSRPRSFAAYGSGAGSGVGVTGYTSGTSSMATAAFGDSSAMNSGASPGSSPSSFGASGSPGSSDSGFGMNGGFGASPSIASGGGSQTSGFGGQKAGYAAVDQEGLKIVADDNKNSLLILADDRDYRRILQVVRTMDVVPSQVLIQAVVAEVTLNDALQYGVQWQFQHNGNPTASFTDLAAGGVGAAFPGFNYAYSAANVAATMSALNQITHVNVLSTPSLMVLDNKTAALQVGDQVPITTQTSTSTLTTNGAIVNSVEMRDTGVILSVTPRINESGRIQLDIEQEVSSVEKTTTSDIDSPTIQQRRVKTTVVVNDGEVLALGGMIQNKVEKDSTQIPILGDIPYIGAAFASRNHTISKTELIILITPRIVRNAQEGRRVTEEFRRQTHVYAPPLPRDENMSTTVQRIGERP